ncbi:hypothetical protein TNCV_1277571 [Trichonephila clavipes]|nr:hypothetical protein TNCV_1277571 [Trichonephila clavipes]
MLNDEIDMFTFTSNFFPIQVWDHNGHSLHPYEVRYQLSIRGQATPRQHHGPKLRDAPFPKTTSPRLFRSFFFPLSVFPDLLKHQGQSISPPHAFSLVDPNESRNLILNSLEPIAA